MLIAVIPFSSTPNTRSTPIVGKLEMIRLHEERRKGAGEPPAYYFFDIFVLNQVMFRAIASFLFETRLITLLMR